MSHVLNEATGSAKFIHIILQQMMVLAANGPILKIKQAISESWDADIVQQQCDELLLLCSTEAKIK